MLEKEHPCIFMSMESNMDCIERENKLIIECNDWEELCEDLIDRIEDIPNLKKTSNDRLLIERFYKLKGHYGESR